MRYLQKHDIVEHRNKYFLSSSVIVLLGVIILLTLGFNYGVDFSSGTSLDIRSGKPTTQDEVTQLFEKSSVTLPKTVTVGGENNDRISARFQDVISLSDVQKIENVFIEKFGDQVTKEENTVDPSIAKELAQKAIYGVLWASIGIIIYVSVRFEWRFAIAAIIALLHDAFIVVSAFSIFRLEVNLPFVAAVLTIIGYSINDTIVVFDRIRENLRFAKIKQDSDLKKIVNDSIYQTLTRSINTTVTVIFPAMCLLIFGSPALKLFSLAIVIGLISGAYSSIFIASQLWFILKKNSMKAKKMMA